jgi:hypothetical protein
MMKKIIIWIMIMAMGVRASDKGIGNNAAIDIAKEFVSALSRDDRNRVEELTGGSTSILHFIYEDANALVRAKRMLQMIDASSWVQHKRTNGSIEVRAIVNDATQQFPIVFEMIRIKERNGKFAIYVSDLH